MTPERARYLLDHKTLGGGLRRAFRFPWDHGQVYADGMTRSEYEAARALWLTMPGSSCFYSAVCEIARQATPAHADGAAHT